MAFEQLLAVLEEQRELAREELGSPPQACPNDGTPLLEGPDHQLFCPFDGWPNANN